MSDTTSNDRAKTALRQKETPLNNDGGKGQKVCSPSQSENVTPYKSRSGHPDAKR
jgi:hypothetical protein